MDTGTSELWLAWALVTTTMGERRQQYEYTLDRLEMRTLRYRSCPEIHVTPFRLYHGHYTLSVTRSQLKNLHRRQRLRLTPAICTSERQDAFMFRVFLLLELGNEIHGTAPDTSKAVLLTNSGVPIDRKETALRTSSAQLTCVARMPCTPRRHGT
jgi:hypothetical protein